MPDPKPAPKGTPIAPAKPTGSRGRRRPSRTARSGWQRVLVVVKPPVGRVLEPSGSVPSPRPAGRRGSRGPEPVDNAVGRAAAGLAVGLAATVGRVDASLDQPPHDRLRQPR